MKHFRIPAEGPLRDRRQRETIHPAAYRDGNTGHPAQHVLQFGELVRDLIHLRSFLSTTCSASRLNCSRSARPPITLSRSSASTFAVVLPGRSVTFTRTCLPPASTVLPVLDSLRRCRTW